MHYVCSDIHGQYDLYRRLLQELDLQESDTLYIIGDVIDRGPDSISILKDIMARPNVEMFLGNHELMMLDYYGQTGSRPERWMLESNGGLATFEKMGLLTEEEQEEIRSFIKNAWIQKYIEVDGILYALHHSYWLENYAGKDMQYSDLEPSEWQSVFRAVWYSPYRTIEFIPADAYEDEYIHIIGHIPVQYILKTMMDLLDSDDTVQEIRPPYIDADGHLYDLDGGCAMIGRMGVGGLYCMSLEADADGRRTEFWIQ